MTDYKPLLQYKRVFDETKGRETEIKMTMKKIEKDGDKQTMIAYDRVARVRIMQGRTEDRFEELAYTFHTFEKKIKSLSIPDEELIEKFLTCVEPTTENQLNKEIERWEKKNNRRFQQQKVNFPKGRNGLVLMIRLWSRAQNGDPDPR